MFNNRDTHGTSNPNSKLSTEDIEQLRAMKGIESSKATAKIMNCSVRTVQMYWKFHTIEQVKVSN